MFAVIVANPDDHYQNFTSHRYDFTGGSTDNDSEHAVVMCQEHHIICLDTPTGSCTQFIDISNALGEMIGVFEDNKTTKQLCEFWEIFQQTRTVALLQQDGGQVIHPWSEIRSTLWTSEAIKWFEGAVLLTRFNLHA